MKSGDDEPKGTKPNKTAKRHREHEHDFSPDDGVFSEWASEEDEIAYRDL